MLLVGALLPHAVLGIQYVLNKHLGIEHWPLYLKPFRGFSTQLLLIVSTEFMVFILIR